MKVVLIVLMIFPVCFLGQIEIIESIKLDSLIYEKINDYRFKKGVSKFIAFEDSLMREFSFKLTRNNAKKEIIEHSQDNKFEFYNAECIYSYRIHCSSIERVQELKESNLDFWANSAVNAWIDSPSHEHAISHEYYTIATITSRIEIDANSLELFFVTSFHALANDRSTISGYVYHPK